MKVIAAMPAYNEERYIGTVVLKTRQYADEVIVFDDGSTDETSEIARIAGATILQRPKRKGKGASIQGILTDVKKRVPDVLILLDADGQHDPDEIPRLISPVLDGADLVIGTRNAQANNTPKLRRFGQKVLLYLTRIISSKDLTDSESGFRALSPKAISDINLTEKGFAVEAEMIVKAVENGLKIAEVPISNIYVNNGK